MRILDCPPLYNENYPELNDDAWFVSAYRQSQLNPELHDTVKEILRELESGSGYVLLKNVYHGNNIQRAKAVLLNVCRHIGWPVSQTPAVKFIEEITLKSVGNTAAGNIGYRSRSSMPLHTDRCDINVLLCHTPATKGGTTRIISSTQLYHKIRELLPPLQQDVLTQAFPFSRHGENSLGESPFYLSRLFYPAPQQNQFVAHYIRCFIEHNLEYLTSEMIQLMDLIDSNAQGDDIGCDFQFSKGDMLFMNSHTTLHARAAYSGNETERLLLRMWLSHSSSRKLPDEFNYKFKNTAPGTYRGGIWGSEACRQFYAGQFLEEIAAKPSQ
ncbi:TauD/TfdA family dioxygenase [Escherichia coli]|uniref:TauD/TfdA family dioxygenase n=1 Tax=Escherichia coli TaxID=562 RepID=UPI00234D7B98|nr:TauD/TfdA family dioxygenase [Escherichia coli]MDC6759046.1 TauD/TfdA family dioxygenase [Escherichia coli]